MAMRIIIGAAAGAVLGFGWHNLVGCPAAGCPLTRNPWVTTAYGALLGMLFAGSYR